MKKILTVVLTLFLCLSVQAKGNKESSADFLSVIRDSGLDKNSVAISLKDFSNGKTVYELNEKMLMHPASVQKALTIIPAVQALGEDYEFETQIYKRNENSYIIKLGADPYLTSKNLKTLVSSVEPETKKIYIDDSILEKKDWGEGWQWDDDMNILMPKFNSYNLDGNLIKITIMPSEPGQRAVIINPSKLPIAFINNVFTGEKNGIKAARDNNVSTNTLTLEGCVNKPTAIYIPVNNLKRHFNIKLSHTLQDKKVYLKDNFVVDTLDDSDVYIGKVTHPMSVAINDILKSSNNMVSETVAKLAGGKMYNDKGTDINGIKVFYEYCKQLGLDTSKIRITDASGVSKNNMLSTDFISEYLFKNKNNDILTNLPKPGEGTLTHRMLFLKDNLQAKTGTLSDTSSIAGFLTAKSGKKYVFCIMINDTSVTVSDMKTLEDYLLREAYLKL